MITVAYGIVVITTGVIGLLALKEERKWVGSSQTPLYIAVHIKLIIIGIVILFGPGRINCP